MKRRFGVVTPVLVAAGLFAATVNLPHVARAKIVYVDSSTGAAGNSGLTPEEALQTITEGAPLLEPGDEMVVGPGVYFERPEFYIPGADAEHPVWIRAYPLGSAVISTMWVEAARGQVLWETTAWDGIYSAEHELALFGAHDGTLLFRFNTVEDLDSSVVQFYSEMEDQIVTLDWTQIKSDAPNATQGIHYFNNVFWGGDHALLWLSREFLHFRNNILLFTHMSDAEDLQDPLDSDYNLLVNATDMGWIRGEHGLYQGDDPR